MAAGPTKDVKEFQFKTSGQLRIFQPGDKLNIDNPVKLVTSASKYGLLFVGTPTGLISIMSNSIINNPEIQNKPLTVTSDFPRRSFPLPSQPTHLDVSSDHELLAVAIRIQDIPVLQIYSVASFGSLNVVKKTEMRMSNTAGVRVLDFQWNPGVPNVIGAVMNDGSVVAFEIKDTAFSLNSLPPTTSAKCLCWSPKGKQVVIGSADGSLTQYKPDLKQVKTLPPPFPSASIISVHWPSSFQFIAAYINTATPHDRPSIVVVNVPKGGQVSYVKYDDVCFGSLNRRPEYYFIHQQAWNMIIVGCGDSMELSVLGLEPNSVNWVHWKQDDATRAELPLTEDKDDSHNLGMTLDFSPSNPIQINDSLTVGPMPVVVSLSHDGILCWFTALNLLPGAVVVCSPPHPFPDQSGATLFTLPPKQQAVPQPPVQSQPLSLQPAPVQPAPVQPASQTTPAFTQPSSLFTLGSTPQSQPQMGNLFSQPSNSLSAPTFGQPSISSAFSSPVQLPSMFSSQSNFSQTCSLFSKEGGFAAPKPTVTQASPAAVQQVTPQPTTSQPLTLSMPSLTSSSTPSNATVKPLLPTTATAASFIGMGQPNSMFTSAFGLAKQETAPFTQPVQPAGAFGLSTEKKAEPKAEVNILEPSLPAVVSQPIPVEKQEEKVDTAEIDRAACLATICDELTTFQEEFTGVKQYLSSLTVEVGEEKMKGELNAKLDSYEVFSGELVETTQAQSSEVASLRPSLLDMISWIQLIKTKQLITKNPSLIEMREAEDMDPIGKHWCKQIEQRLYSLQSQVKQASEQIETLKNSDNGGLYLPTFEAVLQTIINQTKIASTQKVVMTNIECKLCERMKKYQHRKKQVLRLKQSARSKTFKDESQLSTLAQKLLQTKLEASDNPWCSYRESSQNMIAEGVKTRGGIHPSKAHFLKEWHKNHTIIYTKVSPRHLSVSSSDFNSPLKPQMKQTPSKKLVSFTGDKVEPQVIKPVPSTPLNRYDNKTGLLSRNLFAAPADSSISTEIEPLSHDVKGMFEGGVTSTPLPVAAKKDHVKSNIISPSLFVPTTLAVTTVQQVTISPSSFAATKSSANFGQPPIFPPSTLKTAVTKSSEVQPPSTATKVPFGSASNTPVFSFGTITNKENVSLDSSRSASSLTSNVTPTSKPVAQSQPLFGSLIQQADNNKISNEESNPVSFHFGSNASSLQEVPSSLTIEKALSLKETTSATAPPSQPFTFSLVSTSSNSSAGVTSTTFSSSLFPFSQNTSSTVSPSSHSTSTVNTLTNTASTFSFGSVSSAIPAVSNPALTVTPTSQSIISLNFGAAVANATGVPATVVSHAPSVISPAAISSPLAASAASTTAPVSSPLLSQPTIPTTSSFPSEQVTGSSLKPAVSTTSVFVAPTTTSIPEVSSPASTVATVAVFSANSASPPTSTTAATTVATSTSSIFNPSQNSFGSPSFKPTSTAAPTFGTSSFGSFAASTTTASLFGSGSMKFTPATTGASVFGQTPAVASTTSSVTQSTLFSQVATTSASPFGQPATSTQSQSSPFSQTAPTQSTTNSPFSQTSTTFTSTTPSFGGSAFGSASSFSPLATNTFGGGSTFGTPTTTPSVFGTPTTTASSLFNTPMFGQTNQNAASPFGAVTGQPSPFGTATTPTQPQSSPFGASSPIGNPFFNQSQSSVFGQSPSSGNFGSSGGSIFGGSSSFGAGTQGGQFQPPGGNIFGGAGGGPFSSSGGQTVGQAGFGAAPSFQTPKQNSGGFGSSPVFGSSPSFGGAPAFGASASFGSPSNKVFGSPAPVPPGSGFSGQSNNMFESLANQNTMSFGNLAQGQQPPGMTPTFGSPQPPQQQTAPSFGGNAFSSWR